MLKKVTGLVGDASPSSSPVFVQDEEVSSCILIVLRKLGRIMN